jgi:NDP-sugar pyrophosphorylase family protein
MSETKTESSSLLPVAVLAGGLGTRLGEIARDRPKALARVAGEPFIFHQLRLLASHGARRVVLCVGHLGDKIVDAVGDGARFGVDVAYAFDGPEPVGTASALRRASHLLGRAFLVTYGDAYLRIDYAAVQRVFDRSGLPALMTVLRNDGEWGPSNAVFECGRVTAYNKRAPPSGARWVDYGLLAFEARVFEEFRADDLATVCCELASRGSLGGFLAQERFYEIGTPAALAEADAFLRGVRRV